MVITKKENEEQNEKIVYFNYSKIQKEIKEEIKQKEEEERNKQLNEVLISLNILKVF